MRQLLILSLLFFALLISTAGAQVDSTFKITQLTEKIYQLTTDQGSYTTNVLLSIGEDGILIVDTDSESNAEELKKIVESFKKGIPKYIINTHRHVEHVGGNAIFGKEPVVIAHYLVPSKLRSGGYLFDEFPDATFPDITFTDSLLLNFNGEQIRLVEMGGSHDDNEIMVHFTESKIAHISSLVNGLNFPSIDADGDLLRFPEIISKAISLLPEDVTIVSGHNNNCKWGDLQRYHGMIVKTIEIVRKGLDDGKDVETLQKEKVLEEFQVYNKSYVDIDTWIDYIASGINKETPKKEIYEPLYYALKDGGASAAIEKYNHLKNNYSEEYNLKDVYLLVIGDKLLSKDKISDAISILAFCLKEFPEGEYAYYTNYTISNAYKEQDNKEKAIKYCEKSLELKPEFKAAASLLEELKKM